MERELNTRADRATAMREDRRKLILDAALRCARASGYMVMRRDEIADAARISHGSVNHAFGTIAALREAVMREAIQRGDAAIIAQGLAAGDAIARDAPDHLKKAAIEAIA